MSLDTQGRNLAVCHEETETSFLTWCQWDGHGPLAFFLRGAGVKVEAFDDYFRNLYVLKCWKLGLRFCLSLFLIKNRIILFIQCHQSIGLKAIFNPRYSSKIYKRGDFLAEYSKSFNTVAIVGSHGKTTTTGMLTWALAKKDFSFSYLVGGRFKDDALPIGNYQNSPWLVVEVDESDGTVIGFYPDITLVLNYDWDHVDEYKKEGSLEHTFQGLLSRTKSSVILPRKSGLLSWANENLSVDVSSFEANHSSADFMVSNWEAAKACGRKMGAQI